jgi:hypothetical protein
MPPSNARFQPHLEAGAQRTLEGVGSTAMLGSRLSASPSVKTFDPNGIPKHLKMSEEPVGPIFWVWIDCPHLNFGISRARHHLLRKLGYFVHLFVVYHFARVPPAPSPGMSTKVIS